MTVATAARLQIRNIKIGLSKTEISAATSDVRASEDVAHVVDFLIAGLYNDDEALFSGFVTRTADDIVEVA